MIKNKTPKMPSERIVINAPYLANKMVKEYLLYIDKCKNKKAKAKK